jgi:preprotein translocase SecE subunit
MIFKIKKKNKSKEIKKTKVNKPKKELPAVLKPLGKVVGFFTKILKPIGRYFKGSWQELKQVRWPNRGATWSLTGAVILFTAIFMLIIILLDAGFDALFNLILE